MFYNDDFFKRMKTILRCCLDIEVYVDCERLLIETFGNTFYTQYKLELIHNFRANNNARGQDTVSKLLTKTVNQSLHVYVTQRKGLLITSPPFFF